ncbi:MAG: TetR/AcrR family transcriptional regulator [Actinomycetaceae bacterium]|nr:TetR/AcrR family transcriptional regulator [Actinomycetaceae bacterium]
MHRPARIPPSSEEKVYSYKRQMTRKRLVESARDLFARKGIKDTTVEEICENQNLSRGSFYPNFDDVDDLIKAVIDREFGLVQDTLESLGTRIKAEKEAPSDLSGQGLYNMWYSLLEALPLTKIYYLLSKELHLYAFRNPSVLERLREGMFECAYILADGLESMVDVCDLRSHVDSYQLAIMVSGVVMQHYQFSLYYGYNRDHQIFLDKTARSLTQLMCCVCTTH